MIEVQHLTKRYGRFTAVDAIDFTAAPGRVTGFLGPNGAGKSTTLRMICGLTPPTSGSATVLGRPYRSLPNPTVQVGVLLDAAAQHPGRTGREILQLAAMITGQPDRRVAEVLDLVGLTAAESERRVKNYSLGMRQRLGIGGALIGRPEVLVLDEPANGLDPAGIHWMRSLLNDFADSGGTVLLSSHLLSEVEQVADDVLVIGRGRIVAAGPLHQLLDKPGCVVDAVERDRLAEALGAAGIGHRRRPDGAFDVQAERPRVGELALTEHLALTLLRAADGARLEDLFLDLTADSSREKAAA